MRAPLDARFEIGIQGPDLMVGPFALMGVSKDAPKQGRVEFSLDEVVLGSALHGAEGCLFVVLPRENDDRRLVRLRPDAGDVAEPSPVRQRQVEQYDLEDVVAEQIERLAHRLRPSQIEGAFSVAQRDLRESPVARVVFDEQDTHGFRRPPGWRGAGASRW